MQSSYFRWHKSRVSSKHQWEAYRCISAEPVFLTSLSLWNGKPINICHVKYISNSFEETFFFKFSFVFYSAGNWTQGLKHVKQVIYHWTIPRVLPSMPPPKFGNFLGIFFYFDLVFPFCSFDFYLPQWTENVPRTYHMIEGRGWSAYKLGTKDCQQQQKLRLGIGMHRLSQKSS